MTFRITKPGFYRNRDGRKEEVFAVLPERADDKYPVKGGNSQKWGLDGKWITGEYWPYDLVAEWVEPVVCWVNYYSQGASIWRDKDSALRNIKDGCIATRAFTLRDGKIVDVTDEVG